MVRGRALDDHQRWLARSSEPSQPVYSVSVCLPTTASSLQAWTLWLQHSHKWVWRQAPSIA